MRLLFVLACMALFAIAGAAQNPAPNAGSKPAGAEPVQPPASTVEQRTKLNLLGQTDTQAGESRRNENVQFNLVDNNLLRELNTRLGTTATIVTEFRPDRNYFGVEYGNCSGRGPARRARDAAGDSRPPVRIAPEQHLQRPVVFSSGRREARPREQLRRGLSGAAMEELHPFAFR